MNTEHLKIYNAWCMGLVGVKRKFLIGWLQQHKYKVLDWIVHNAHTEYLKHLNVLEELLQDTPQNTKFTKALNDKKQKMMGLDAFQKSSGSKISIEFQNFQAVVF